MPCCDLKPGSFTDGLQGQLLLLFSLESLIEFVPVYTIPLYMRKLQMPRMILIFNSFPGGKDAIIWLFVEGG